MFYSSTIQIYLHAVYLAPIILELNKSYGKNILLLILLLYIDIHCIYLINVVGN